LGLVDEIKWTFKDLEWEVKIREIKK